jgi:hypothetical protein
MSLTIKGLFRIILKGPQGSSTHVLHIKRRGGAKRNIGLHKKEIRAINNQP